MNFDDLFGLLLFLVFIALPAISRMAGKRRGGASPTPGTPATGQTSTASTRPTVPAAGDRGATLAPVDDELERRLAAARERVRHALEGQQRRAGSAPSSGSPATPSPRPLVAPPRPPAPRTNSKFVTADRDDGLLGTPLDPTSIGMLGSRERAPERARATRFAEAPALQVERPGSRAGPRSAHATAAFATDPETIRSAILWHQVLGEPRARRPLGGRPSTLRSR